MPCKDAVVTVGYNNAETNFALEFSRQDGNITPQGGTINGIINDTINALNSYALGAADTLRISVGISNLTVTDTNNNALT